MKWESKATVIKGDIGEDIVDEYLIKKGYIPYKPACGGAHPFDRMCATKDKKTIFIVEVKSKAKRKYYPDTGINISHFDDYKNIYKKYGIDVYLFFVDEEQGTIYGRLLRELEIERVVTHKGNEISYPLKQGRIIYFPIACMRLIARLDDEKVRELTESTTKKQAYL